MDEESASCEAERRRSLWRDSCSAVRVEKKAAIRENREVDFEQFREKLLAVLELYPCLKICF